jgi:hypothetical protein
LTNFWPFLLVDSMTLSTMPFSCGRMPLLASRFFLRCSMPGMMRSGSAAVLPMRMSLPVTAVPALTSTQSQT